MSHYIETVTSSILYDVIVDYSEKKKRQQKGFSRTPQSWNRRKMDLLYFKAQWMQTEMFSIGQSWQKLKTRGTKEKRMRETKDVSLQLSGRNLRNREKI